MRIKLDENLPESLLREFGRLGHEVDNVRLEGLVGHSDAVVWANARASHRLFITQDLDFSDVRQFAPGTHPGLILVRMRLPGRVALANRLISVFHTENVENWTRCFVLITDRKIRVHKPK